MKMEGLRRVYGMAEPIRRGMELKIVRDSKFVPMMLGGPRRNGGDIHEDILVLGGRDTEIGWEDVFHGQLLSASPLDLDGSRGFEVSSMRLTLSVNSIGDEFREPPSIHDEMEKRLRMDC